ncbi:MULTISPECIES: glucosyltransferase domain-containing protein [unclassified Campylobacter]|uniref:glucosyltransferase domain-containing protein n=1 Tax=unclassified Campylobacter TaxID=2593542 RepID=UPI0022E9D85D|nr:MULTISPECIES: glucosyltransferase domain-containing protein [unclassified Campylobacter]MDA3062434.1 glucosyltransferase domain-containing protein [Campylobacter sp. JMF_14 EL1]MDA3073447.1 glucosyltransferase domain-containing protein [Campylobacter sp. JMF_10 EL2]
MNLVNLKRILKFDYLTFLAITRSFFKDKNFLKYFGFIFTLYFIGMFAIIRANNYFVDDNIRSVNGTIGAWGSLGRHSMVKMSEFFNLGLPLVEFSPFSNFLCIFFLSLSSIVLVKTINYKITYIALLGSLFIGLNPYWLENLLYKFDSVYMCISMFMTILPFLFFKRPILFFVISTLSLLIMLTTYQSVSFVYPLIAMFMAFLWFSGNKKTSYILKFIFNCIMAYLIALIIFKLFIYKPFNGHISTDTFAMAELFTGILGNIIKFSKDIYFNFCDTLLFKLMIFCIFLSYLTTIFKFKNFKSLILLTIFLIIGFSFSQGIFLLLKKMELHARYISTIGVFCAIILIYISSNLKIKILKIVTNLCVIYVAYSLLFMSNTLGSILEEQEKYLDFRANLVMQDLAKIDNISYDKLAFSGSIIAPSVITPLNKFFVFDKVIKYKKQANPHGYSSLTRKFGFIRRCETKGNSKTLFDTNFHKISQYDNGCIKIDYKSGGKYEEIDFKFVSKYIIKNSKTLLSDYALRDDLKFSLYSDERKKGIGINTLIFEFDKEIPKIASRGDTTLAIHLHQKDKSGFIHADQPIQKFKKIGGKYYYSVCMANVDINSIERIEISFWNHNIKKDSAKFSINLKEPK